MVLAKEERTIRALRMREESHAMRKLAVATSLALLFLIFCVFAVEVDVLERVIGIFVNVVCSAVVFVFGIAATAFRIVAEPVQHGTSLNGICRSSSQQSSQKSSQQSSHRRVSLDSTLGMVAEQRRKLLLKLCKDKKTSRPSYGREAGFRIRSKSWSPRSSLRYLMGRRPRRSKVEGLWTTSQSTKHHIFLLVGQVWPIQIFPLYETILSMTTKNLQNLLKWFVKG